MGPVTLDPGANLIVGGAPVHRAGVASGFQAAFGRGSFLRCHGSRRRTGCERSKHRDPDIVVDESVETRG